MDIYDCTSRGRLHMVTMHATWSNSLPRFAACDNRERYRQLDLSQCVVAAHVVKGRSYVYASLQCSESPTGLQIVCLGIEDGITL